MKQKDSIYPAIHIVVVKSQLADTDPVVMGALFDAFKIAKQNDLDRIRINGHAYSRIALHKSAQTTLYSLPKCSASQRAIDPIFDHAVEIVKSIKRLTGEDRPKIFEGNAR